MLGSNREKKRRGHWGMKKAKEEDWREPQKGDIGNEGKDYRWQNGRTNYHRLHFVCTPNLELGETWKSVIQQASIYTSV